MNGYDFIKYLVAYEWCDEFNCIFTREDGEGLSRIVFDSYFQLDPDRKYFGILESGWHTLLFKNSTLTTISCDMDTGIIEFYFDIQNAPHEWR